VFVVINALADAVGIVLLWASIQKIRDRMATVEMLAGMAIPSRARFPAYIGICTIEGVAGLALLLTRGSGVALVGAVAVSSVLVLVSVWFLLHPANVTCSCFGRSDRLLGRDTIVDSTALLMTATVALLLGIAHPGATTVSGGVLTTLTCGIALVGTYRVASASPTLRKMRRDRIQIERALQAHALNRAGSEVTT
jgi:hypothetical protein